MEKLAGLMMTVKNSGSYALLASNCNCDRDRDRNVRPLGLSLHV